MSRHRAQPTRRRPAAPLHQHAASQPRYGRIGVLAITATVCLVATLGGFGVLPSVVDPGDGSGGDSTVARDLTGRGGGAADNDVLVLDSADQKQETAPEDATPDDQPEVVVPPVVDAVVDEALPADSGEGYRVVFSEGRQRVWLVDAENRVERTYLVSGSLYDNLDPGVYEVYSRSEQAYAFDGSGSMKHFVRFAEGDTGAAIGFHDIPLDNEGDLVQTRAQLGTPQSHGCIRQERDDAVALWEFTEIGTEVVVV